VIEGAVNHLLFMIVFLVSITTAYVSFQFMEVCGCTSSLVKQPYVVGIWYLYVAVVSYLMRFMYSDMWLYPNCVESVSS
jgi:hypothetical protein